MSQSRTAPLAISQSQTHPTQSPHRYWVPDAWLAGLAAGQTFLVFGLFLCRQDLWWPGDGRWAGWIALNSVAIYGLVGGLVGVAIATTWQLPAILLRILRIDYRASFAPLTYGVVLQGLVVWIYWTLVTQAQLSGLSLNATERWSALVVPTLASSGLTSIVILGCRVRPKRRRSLSVTAGRLQPLTLGLTMALVAAAIAGSWGLRLRPPAIEATSDVPQSVLVVGLDGATLRILDPMMRAGELTTLARLREEGAVGSLLTYGPAASPLVWTSIATGKRSIDHGVRDFVVRGEGDYRPRAVQSGDLTARTAWDLLGSRGLRVGIVDWLVSYPPKPVAGDIITHLQHPQGSRSEPKELDAEIQQTLGAPPSSGTPLEHQFETKVARAFDGAELLLRRSATPGATPRIDLLALFESQTDEAQHQRWRDLRPEEFADPIWGEHTTNRVRSEIIPNLYRQIDLRLGQLLEQLPRETITLVLSDHGALAQQRPRTRVRMDLLLSELGFAELDASGRADPATSQVYSLPQTPGQTRLALNLNQTGRESTGIVPSGAVQPLLERVTTQLSEVRLADGSRLFGKITTGGRSDLTLGHSRWTRTPSTGQQSLSLPDGRRIPLTDIVGVDLSITGDHDYQGILWAHGPGIRRGWLGPRVATTALQEIVWRTTDRVGLVDALLPTLRQFGFVERATTLDITPTLLHLFGLPKGRDMSGRVLLELLDRPAPTDEIATWESLPADPHHNLSEPAPDGSDGTDGSDGSDEDLERLRALGYLN